MKSLLASFLFTVAIASSASAQLKTSSTGNASAPPDIVDVVQDGCPGGSALVGLTVDRTRGKSVALRPRCRPAPLAEPDAWCDPTPPAGISCACDGFEALQWRRLGTAANNPGCWACVGTGATCARPPSCNCISDTEGAWVPVTCNAAVTVTNANQMRTLDASKDMCVRMASTGCTFRAVPDKSC